ncbi:hypothetical protein ABPG75_010650 [Micractinium tetrahymenae]
MRPSAALAALLACLAATAMRPAHAQSGPSYTGADSFISSFSGMDGASVGGLTLRPVTAGSMFGLGMGAMSALQITLEPCTMLQPHIHPHAEFAFTVSGKPTYSIVYNNGTLANLTSNTASPGAGGFAIFPAGLPHVVQNEGCSPAVVQAVFPVPTPDVYFFPLSEASLPANTIASFFGGKQTAATLSTPAVGVPLAGCSCGGRRMRV